MKFRSLFILALGFIFGGHLMATEIPPNACEAALSSPKKPQGRAKFVIIPSPRAEGDAEKYREYVKELTEPGGVLDRLGIQMTGQVVEFLQPRDLNALTSGSAGGFPVSHYLDGASALQSLNPRSGFALEVVYPGPDYQHGFYRDDNVENQQFSIIDHVVGHNHFAFTSGLTHYRYGQGLVATRKIDDILLRAYREYNKDEVQRFYLWALTLQRLWDWYAPLLQPSSEFETYHRHPEKDALGRRLRGSEQQARPVTENILSSFAANLAVDEPGYKKELLEQMITAFSFRPALVHTQIMNEGWASIMQEIIPKHTKNHHNFNFWAGASKVMQAEAKPNLRDPYSLGVACWRRIRERLWAEPGMRDKTPLEKDHAFIEKGSEIIATMTDEEFLRFAMDQVFVDRFNLAVVKSVPRPEWKNLPPPEDPEQNGQWAIVSKNADRVVQMVIDRVLKPKYFLNPRVRQVSLNRPGSGEVELILDDEVGVALPLEKSELAPALFALAKVMNKPISLVGTVLVQAKLERVRVVVAPNADVKVYRITDPRKFDEISALPPQGRALAEVLDDNLTAELTGFMAAYLEDLYLEDDAEFDRVVESSPALRELRNQGIAKMIEALPYDGMVSQAPNAAGAIMEYKSMLERRLMKALERASRRKGGLRGGPGGKVRVKALPSVVNIEFDRSYIESAKSNINVNHKISVTSINRSFAQTSPVRPSPFNPDEADRGSVGELKGNEGDHFWGPGEGGGEGQRGAKPGEDASDPSWVELPEGMYEKFLGEKVKLPILNRKDGQSRLKAKRQGGSIRKKQGVLLPNEVLNNALKKGISGMQGEGLDPFDDLGETLEAGFDRLQPRDIVVKSKLPAKKPNIKAVVTFVLDASGSTAHYMEAFKRFVNDTEVLIRASYPGCEFRYVIFDTRAHVMKSKADFFRFELGGGTQYRVGIKAARDLIAQYPRAQYDKYTFLLGDMEDFDAQGAHQEIMQTLEETEYYGVVAGLYRDGVELANSVSAESQSNPALGYTVIDPDGEYRLENIREVLKNKVEN